MHGYNTMSVVHAPEVRDNVSCACDHALDGHQAVNVNGVKVTDGPHILKVEDAHLSKRHMQRGRRCECFFLAACPPALTSLLLLHQQLLLLRIRVRIRQVHQVYGGVSWRVAHAAVKVAAPHLQLVHWLIQSQLLQHIRLLSSQPARKTHSTSAYMLSTRHHCHRGLARATLRPRTRDAWQARHPVAAVLLLLMPCHKRLIHLCRPILTC